MAWNSITSNPYGTTDMANLSFGTGASSSATGGFLKSMPWLQVGGAILGGGLNAINQSKARMQQRNAINEAVEAERDYRKELIQEKRGSINDDQGNLNMLLSNIALNQTPQAVIAAQQTYNQISQTGSNRRSQIDTEVAASHKMEQQLEASKPDKYDFWDATTDFVTGAIGGGQAAQGFADQSQARDRRATMEAREDQAFELDQQTNNAIFNILNGIQMNLQGNQGIDDEQRKLGSPYLNPYANYDV